jgi:hypothetical protein
MNDSDILEVSRGDGAVNGMLLDEGNPMARSARSRWSEPRVIARWSSARGRRGSVVDECFVLARTVTNQYVREVRQRRGERIEPEGELGIPWPSRNLRKSVAGTEDSGEIFWQPRGDLSQDLGGGDGEDGKGDL